MTHEKHEPSRLAQQTLTDRLDRARFDRNMRENDQQRYESGERSHHTVAAYLANIKTVGNVKPHHDEIYLAVVDQADSIVVMFTSRYGRMRDHKVRMLTLKMIPAPEGAYYQVAFENTVVH